MKDNIDLTEARDFPNRRRDDKVMSLAVAKNIVGMFDFCREMLYCESKVSKLTKITYDIERFPKSNIPILMEFKPSIEHHNFRFYVVDNKIESTPIDGDDAAWHCARCGKRIIKWRDTGGLCPECEMTLAMDHPLPADDYYEGSNALVCQTLFRNWSNTPSRTEIFDN